MIADRLAAQEATIMRQNVELARRDKRIAEQQRIIASQKNAIAALQRQMKTQWEGLWNADAPQSR